MRRDNSDWSRKNMKNKPLKVISYTLFNDGHKVIVHEGGVIVQRGTDIVFILKKGRPILKNLTKERKT